MGLLERDAKQAGLQFQTYTVDLKEVDRAVLDEETEGFARVHVEDKSGRILGATLVGRRAGDMLGEVVLAMSEGIPMGALSGAIAPYPTQGDVWKRLADAHQRTRLTPGIVR